MAKRKIKKFLKKAAPLLAVAGLGKAFMNARNRRDMINSATADDGFGFMDMRDYGPFSKKRGIIPQNMMTSEDMANDPMFFNAMAKDGGRIKKTKKGGRAVRKANRSKKK